jgi:hypothetical protein
MTGTDYKSHRIEPPSGWDSILFVDGLKAQIVGATTETVDGKDMVRYYLLPFDDLKKRYKISNDMLDENLCLERIYEKNCVVTLNEDDPARKLKFCIVNFDGKPTYATRWFLGYLQIQEINKLRDMLEQIRVENAALKEENILLKTNVPKYIKTHFSDVMNDLLPLFRQAVTSGQEASGGEYG